MSSPSRGTHFGDGIRVGTQIASGYDNALPGAPVSPLFIYDIAPQAASFTNIAALQTLGGAGYVTLVNTGNSGTNTVIVKNYQNFVKFDVPRRIQIRGVASTTLANFTFYGETDYGFDQAQPVTEQIAGPVGATTVTSQKVYTGLYRIYASAGTTQNISIGCADAFGLPFLATNANYIIPYFGGNPSNALPLPRLSTSTLVGGTVTVANTSIKATSLVFASNSTQATPGRLSVPAVSIIPGVSFTINSSNAGDTSVVNWEIVDPTNVSGTATLVGIAGPASAVTVTNGNVLSTDLLELTVNTPSGTAGTISYTIADGAFTITSSNAADRSSINWRLMRPSLYQGAATLAAGGPPSTVTVSSFVVNAQSKIFLNYGTIAGTPGFLYLGAITAGISFVINSTSATDTSAVNWRIVNPVTIGTYILPDRTNPATISTGNPRGVYLPSAPSDGFSRLTVFMYNRGVNNADATPGSDPDDTAQANTEYNLYGTSAYSDLLH